MSITRAVRAVVFDFDGTLVDSLPLVFAAIAHALEPFGRRPPQDIFARLGGPPESFLGQLLGDLAHVPEALERMDTYHRDNARLLQPFPGAADVLTRLQAAGIRIGIWTGRDRVSTEWLLREHRLEGFVLAVVCGDDLPTHKPDPAGLREALRQLGVAPGETLFVGDADVDVQGGAGAQVATVLIRQGREIPASIAALASRMVETPADAYAYVLQRIQECRHAAPAVP